MAGPLAAEIRPLIQEVHGISEQYHGTVYTLKKLKKGDMVYGYMTCTSGNLDPFLGVFRQTSRPEFRYNKVVESVTHSDQNFVDKFATIADEKFIVWDDDGGAGYDASLKFLVPADGDYAVFAGSMLTNLSLDSFEPTFTFGDYRLLFGINAPEVGNGNGVPNSTSIATIDSQNIERTPHVQKLQLRLTADKKYTFHRLRNLKAWDTLHFRLVSTNGHPLPQMVLSDFAGKPITFGKINKSSNVATLNYSAGRDVSGLFISLDGSNLSENSEAGEYQLTAGVNAPEVLLGEEGDVGGFGVFQNSQNVGIGLWIDQIANVDQKSENFTVVGSLQMIWQDPQLAFSPATCECTLKMLGFDDLKALALKNDIVVPTITFFNQQGNRWMETQQVFIEPSGQASYIERFTVTLQAPDFDFRMYPFDQQKFKIRLDLNLPTGIFTFKKVENPGELLGDQLGEEEWIVINYSQEVTEVPFGRNLTNSRFTTILEMRRHVNYYILRIIVPLMLIIGVSWVIFFLKDYGKQLEVASGNLLIFVAFNFTISSDLPRLGYLTGLDRMIITSFCCTALVVFISVWQKRLDAKGRGELAAFIDKIVLTIYPLVYIVFLGAEFFLILSRLGT